MAREKNYQPEIDGLRALAVGPIVLFHARVAGFSGGYVGVDIFYVISGFLITSIIAPEIVGQRFSLADFYERRIRRIFPAFFAMLAVVCILGAIVLTPTDLRAMGKSVMGAAVFAPNVVFWTEAGYFAGASDFKPLLHTWSLGVEEQFYLFFPFTLWLLRRLDRRLMIAGVAAIGLASFALGYVATDKWPVFAFFMIPARAWELMLGALVALGAFPSITNRPVREGLALIGLAATLWAIFGLTGQTPFPGVAALLPVVGSALMIYAAQGTAVGAALSLRPLRQIGLISYSLYLWHWPVVVFWEYLTLHHLTGWEPVGAIGLAVLLATASTYLLEQPFRRPGGVVGHRALFLGALVISLVAFAVGAAMFVSRGAPFRNREAARFGVAALTQRVNLIASPCLAMDAVASVSRACRWGAAAQDKPELILWGDSHGAQLATAIHAAADQRGLPWRQMTKSGCPPIPTPELFPRDSLRLKCPAFDRDALDQAERAPPGSLVLLVARWDAVLSGELRFAPAGPRPDLNRSLSTAQLELRSTIQTLTAKGLQVVVVAQTPVPPQDLPDCLTRARFDHLNPSVCGAFLPEETERAAKVERATLAFLTGATAGLDHVVMVRPWPDLCDAQGGHMVGAEGPLYLDATHLSQAGATRILRHVDAALKAIPPNQRASSLALF